MSDQLFLMLRGPRAEQYLNVISVINETSLARIDNKLLDKLPVDKKPCPVVCITLFLSASSLNLI
jgi:hypothetical protein